MDSTPGKAAPPPATAGAEGAVTDAAERPEPALRPDQIYRIMADTSHDWEYWSTPQGNFVYCSPSCERITGFTVEQFMKDSLIDIRLVHPDDLPRVMDHHQSMVQSASDPAYVQYRIRRSDGSLRWLEHRCHPLFDAKGRFMGRRASIRDVTRRKTAEEELERAQLVLDKIGDMAFWVGEDGRFRYVNDALCRAVGYSREELLTMSNLDLDPDGAALDWAAYWADINRRGSHTFQSRVRTRDGRLFPIEVTVNRVEIDGRLFHCGFARDISERQAAEKALRDSEARFRVMAETLPDILFTLRPDGWCDYVNQRAYETTGAPLGSLEGFEWKRVIHPEDVESTVARLMRSVETGEPMVNEFRLRQADGGHHWMVSRMSPIRDETERIVRWLGSATDIDDLKRAQRDLQASSERLDLRVRERTAELETANAALRAEIAERRRLEVEVLRISELEQGRIGQDLHDGVCQQLAGIAYLADSLAAACAETSRKFAPRVRRVRDLLHRALADAREVARGLSPLHVEGQGLVPALRDLAAATRKNHGVACRVIGPRPVLVKDMARATHLYRIAQEAVHNAIRHGRARSIVIGLRSAKGRVLLTVEDDGRGLPKTARRGKGMGVSSMTYRARSLGGVLEIRNGTRRGVVVTCEAPLPGADCADLAGGGVPAPAVAAAAPGRAGRTASGALRATRPTRPPRAPRAPRA